MRLCIGPPVVGQIGHCTHTFVLVRESHTVSFSQFHAHTVSLSFETRGRPFCAGLHNGKEGETTHYSSPLHALEARELERFTATFSYPTGFDWSPCCAESTIKLALAWVIRVPK